MKKIVLKIIFILIVCICAISAYIYTNTTEYKTRNYQNKYKNEIIELKPIYNKATDYCAAQNFANRGPYTACIEENIKNSSIQNYNFYMDVQNFCENLLDDLVDKWMCMDEILE